MSIKLVACDLDGTLLNDDKVISERNYKAIQTLEDNNIDFLICTGREKNSVIQLKERHHLNCEAIMMNGALYMDKNNNVCFSKKISDEAVKKVIKIFDKYDCDFIVQTLEGIRSRHTYEELIEHFAEHMVEIGWATTLQQAHEKMKDFNFFEGNQKYETIDELLSAGVLKIENHQNHNPDITDDINKELEEIDGISIVYYPSGNVEITDVNATKGQTLYEVMKLKGYSLEEVMPFGDEDNDYSMLSLFPNSVAMCNGNERVKKVSGKISEFSNHEDGVAIEIERLFK